MNLGDEQYSKKDNSIEAEPEPVEAEPVPIEAEPVPVEAEPVLDTDVVYQRPKKDKEVILDLSKPEIQDAEMIDDEDK